MIHIQDQDQLNESELRIVQDYLEGRGTKWATIQKGNDCIWVSSGSANSPINEYFIFHNNKLIDIQID